MRIARVTLKSMENSPYGQNRGFVEPKKPKELDQDYEERIWRNRMHVDKDGHIFIPPMAFKKCLTDIAMFLSEKIPGRRGETWTKHFQAGIMVTDPLTLPVKAADVKGEWIHVPSDGKPGGGRRVWKRFPRIESWEGTITIYIIDEMITAEVLEWHLRQAGMLIGLGRFRPRHGGFYGRFTVEAFEMIEA